MSKRVCFFSNTTHEQLLKEQYSIQDLTILRDLGYDVTVATQFSEIPRHCDLYFSWWASGSIIPFVKAKLFNIPQIVVAGGNEAVFYKDSTTGKPHGYLAASPLKRFLTRLCVQHSHVTIAVSNYMVRHLKQLGCKNAIVVPNSVDISMYTPSERKGSYVTSIFNLDEGVYQLKRGANFFKGLKAVVDKHPGVMIKVIGRKGSAFQKAVTLCDELGLLRNVEFVGAVDNREIVDWMHNTRVYVQPSDTETFGVAIVEAMSCGIPVVVSKMGAIPEVVGEHGIYVDHNDPDSISRGILSVLHMNESQYQELSHSLRKRVTEHFTYEKRKILLQEILSRFIG